MMVRAIQKFEVSLKAFIIRDGCSLFVREADTGYWELPGGRIDVGEEWEPHTTVLAREMREELGADFQIEFGAEALTWTRQRPSDGVFQFIVGRIGWAVAGVPVLSDEHDRIDWFTREQAGDLLFPDNSNYRDAIDRLWRLQLVAPTRKAGG